MNPAVHAKSLRKLIGGMKRLFAKVDRTNNGLRLPSAQLVPSEAAAVVREAAANRR